MAQLISHHTHSHTLIYAHTYPPPPPFHTSLCMQTDDLASLANLDEPVLLEELRVRYDEDKIYTYVGDILVAVNPFRTVALYSSEVRIVTWPLTLLLRVSVSAFLCLNIHAFRSCFQHSITTF